MKTWTRGLLEGGSLSAVEAEAAFGRLVSGSVPTEEAEEFLLALREKGETAPEIAGGVRALRRALVGVPLSGPGLIDTCGTGGGSLKTFNISTAASFVAAAGGVRVAKHGNRSYSSRSGSADVLEALGVAIDVPADAMEEMMELAGFVFMYAPVFHPAMRHVAEARRRLGGFTIMNVLGPLANPAPVRRQMVGVPDRRTQELVAGALCDLGHERALVVYGEPGLDEMSPLGETSVLVVEKGRIEPVTFRPEDFGWSQLSADELRGGEPEENACLIEEVLRGERSGSARAAVLLNAGGAFWVAGSAANLGEGVRQAGAAIDEGRAWSALQRIREVSFRLSGG